ncbi:hypothetical protein [Azotosporobacter soli]|uniref:hypothetical protein n=1 Tax=Azotosporobacter soli TaxID=3055040 RepID=UPI0031FF4166
MKQRMMVTFSVDKEISIGVVSEWLNKQIIATDITEIRMDERDVELVFCGELYTYLGSVVIQSPEAVDCNQLERVCKHHPHFIHQLEFRTRS